MAKIAKGACGNCIGCDLPVETGETFFERAGGPLHLGCPERPAISNDADPWFLTAPAPSSVAAAKVATVESRRPQPPTFAPAYLDGPTSSPADTRRAAGQLQRTFDLMKGGEWFTLKQIAEHVGCLETSASSRVRDFRKQQHGGHRVEPRWSPTTPGIHEYRLLVSANGEHVAA